MTVAQIDWGTAPPPPLSNKRTGLLTCEQIAVAAQMRPGEWGCYAFGTTTQASAYAFRLRTFGLDATSRGLLVYFRSNL
jgi:hypothetical protein